MLQNGAESATMDSIEPVLGARCTVAGAPKPEAPTVAATNSLGERFFRRCPVWFLYIRCTINS